MAQPILILVTLLVIFLIGASVAFGGLYVQSILPKELNTPFLQLVGALVAVAAFLGSVKNAVELVERLLTNRTRAQPPVQVGEIQRGNPSIEFPARRPESSSGADSNHPSIPPLVYLSYTPEDLASVQTLYRRLKEEGFMPWMKDIDILPGADREYEITRAIKASRFFVACLSRNSVDRRGYAQKEVKKGLDILDEFPDGQIFLIPARLEECQVPIRLQTRQVVDVFRPDGMNQLLVSLRQAAVLS